MDESTDNPTPQKNDPAADEGAGAPAKGSDAASPPRLRDLWQVPALVVGVVLFTAGALVALMSRPPYDIDAALRAAEAMIESENGHAQALTHLNQFVAPHLDAPHANPGHRGTHAMLSADAMFLAQREGGFNYTENNERIVALYERAEEHLGELGVTQRTRMIETLVSLGRISEARRRLETIPRDDTDRRLRLLRSIVRLTLQEQRDARATGAAPEALADRLPFTLTMLNEYAAEPGLSPDERRWAIARQAELRIESGRPSESVEHLLRAIQRIDVVGAPGRETGELLYLLGRAYYDLGQNEDARRRLEQAEQAVDETDALRAPVQTLLGRIAQSRTEFDEARERFVAVISDFPTADAAREAWLGLGEVEAMLGGFERSLEAYGRVVEWQGPVAALETSLRERADERYAAGDFEHALRYGALGLKLRVDGREPGWALGSVASAQRALAGELLEPAVMSDGAVDWSLLDPVTREEIRRRLIEAAEHFYAYSRAMIGENDDAYAAALWNAGDSWDRAGEYTSALRAFTEFAQQRPNDQRRPRARFRLAQTHHAQGDYEVASMIYRDLIRENPPSGEGFMSYVPLVQSLLAEDSQANAPEAERLLTLVVDGEVMGPDARDFRVALNELGALHYRAERYPEAIERLQESIDRDPDAADAGMTRFLLADSLRLSAAEIDRELNEAMPQSRRHELQSTRRERLRQAMSLYDQVCAEGVARDQSRMSSLERIAMRNSFFYRADCAFDLGDDALAIAHYDVAANRYADDPASLVAMMQIVNAYARMGRWEEARTANERARQRFRDLPEGAFDRDDLPLERRHWERWLDASTELAQRFEQDDD
ncbi:MAG: tetratricopeptide repeat protein [Phycisphaerales bacterium]|nr:MAG: tetratricopeptide repeat protein [Phycisphaerales bacterium]